MKRNKLNTVKWEYLVAYKVHEDVETKIQTFYSERDRAEFIRDMKDHFERFYYETAERTVPEDAA